MRTRRAQTSWRRPYAAINSSKSVRSSQSARPSTKAASVRRRISSSTACCGASWAGTGGREAGALTPSSARRGEGGGVRGRPFLLRATRGGGCRKVRRQTRYSLGQETDACLTAATDSAASLARRAECDTCFLNAGAAEAELVEENCSTGLMARPKRERVTEGDIRRCRVLEVSQSTSFLCELVGVPRPPSRPSPRASRRFLEGVVGGTGAK